MILSTKMRIDSFYKNAFAGLAVFMWTMEYTTEGDPIISDYSFDHTPPLGALETYYLSNNLNIFTKTSDGGITLIEGLGRIHSPSDKKGIEIK